MKNRICLLLLLLFGLTITGCSRPAEDSIDEKGSSSIPIPNDYFILDSSNNSNSEKHHTTVFSAELVFGHIQEQDGQFVATTLFGSNYIRIDGIELPKNIIAGSTLTIVYDGNIVVDESYPGYAYLENGGRLISYSYEPTHVFGMRVADATISENLLKENYDLPNAKNVIVDKEMHYVPLEEYNGDNIYLSVDKKKEDDYCPEGATCDDHKPFIAGMYAFNPVE